MLEREWGGNRARHVGCNGWHAWIRTTHRRGARRRRFAIRTSRRAFRAVATRTCAPKWFARASATHASSV